MRLPLSAGLSRWPSGEDAVRPLVLTTWAENLGPDTMALTCTTIGGNVAATLQWPSDAPVENLAQAIVAAVESSDFDCPIKPLRAWNLRLIGQDGTQLAMAPESPSLAQQLGLESSTSCGATPALSQASSARALRIRSRTSEGQLGSRAVVQQSGPKPTFGRPLLRFDSLCNSRAPHSPL